VCLATVDQDLVPDEGSVVQLSTWCPLSPVFKGVYECAYWLQCDPCHFQNIIFSGHRQTCDLAL